MKRGLILANMARKMSKKETKIVTPNSTETTSQNLVTDQQIRNRESDLAPLFLEAGAPCVGPISPSESEQPNISGEFTSQSESEEDIFHETDFLDSDFVPSRENSELNSTTESIKAMANVLEANISNFVSPDLNEVELFSTPNKSPKRNKKPGRNLNREYKKSDINIQALEECRMKCKSKINFEQQTSLFKNYWNKGDYNSRRQILSNLIDVQHKKTATLENPNKRKYVYTYHFQINCEKTKVCKKCFLQLYGETEQIIKTICKYKIQQEYGGVAPNDRRGRSVPINKLTVEKHNEVLDFIKSIPKYESHYSRRHTTKLYFQRGLNQASLYRLYKENISNPVSETKFQEIFKTLDIKFKKPQLDLCTQCETLKEKIKNTENIEEKSEISLQLKNHHDAADFAYDCKKKDKELSLQDNSVKMFSFDLQQCLPKPYLKASIFFYKRPLWTFNLTIHDGATNKANCYIWHEAFAKRGANDIGSCIYKCLLGLPNNIKHVILYSDSCTGQNRNSYICAMFAKVLEDHPTIETIDHKFLVVGHTHLECDTVHAQIEKKRKYSSVSIQHPHDWSNLIAATNKKYITQEMKQEEFYNFHALMKDRYTWRSINTNGEKFEWKLVRWLRYVKKEPGLIRYKYSLSLDDPFNELNINACRKKNQNYGLSKCYTGPLPISVNKKRDLIDLLPLFKPELHSFYQNLKVEGESEVEIDSDLDEIEENM